MFIQKASSVLTSLRERTGIRPKGRIPCSVQICVVGTKKAIPQMYDTAQERDHTWAGLRSVRMFSSKTEMTDSLRNRP